MEKVCYAIGGRLNFNENTISLCHGIDIGDKIIWSYDCEEPFTPTYYLKKIGELNELNQSIHPECEGCSNLIEREMRKKKLEIITINPMNFCQNRCVYCANFQGEIKELYHPLPIIKEFIKEGLVADNCLFDWGGGEPTLSNYFEETFMYLLNNGYMQRVNTNCIKLSQVLLNHLDEKLVSLRVSLDSGNAHSFLATKGRNLFEQVVCNLEQYREKTANIVLKYVVTNTNSDKKSVEDFIDMALALKIKTICIDTDMFSYGWNNYEGMLRFTECELKAAKLLKKLADKHELNVQIGYVWTAQNNKVPSRDFNCISDITELNKRDCTYEIPENLSDFHLRRLKEFKNDIMPFVLSGFEMLIEITKNKKVILYGAGNNCMQLMKCLKEFNIDVYKVCDGYKIGEMLDGYKIEGINDVYKQIDETMCVIITPDCVKEIVKEFNQKNYQKLKGKLYCIDSFRYSRKVLDEILCDC